MRARSQEIFQVEDTIMAKTYQKLPVACVRGSGTRLWDAEGREYIDLMGGYGVALLGHCHPRVVEAVRTQVGQLITCHGSLYNDVRARFLESLASIAPKKLSKAYLCNSGAESVESALKLARKHTGRGGVVAMTGSYHGKTMGALSATWGPKYREPFSPLLSDFRFSTFGSLDKLQEAVTKDVGAVIIEPIQGESGIHPAPEGFLQGAKKICDEAGALLIFDEIQSGLGRTGRMWAAEHWNVSPDIMCLAKGLAGGLPMGATLARDDVMGSFKVGEHTSTFGGNPLACSAGEATIRAILEEDLHGRASRVGGLLRVKLEELAEEHGIIREVRGLGLMQALEIKFDIRRILMRGLDLGLILLYSGRNVLRLLPPLVIQEEDILRSSSILDQLLEEEEEKMNG